MLGACGRERGGVIRNGRIESVLPEWCEAHWIGYIDDQAYNWITQGTASETVLDEGIDGLADVLAERYGQAGTYTRSDEIEILVNDITDYNQYSKVLNYLESLNSVTNVEVKEVKLGSVVYLLRTRSDTFVISKSVDL